MMVFRSLAKRHCERFLPGMGEELKAEGIYEQELDRVAQQASEELAALVRGGAQLEAAKEIVLKGHIFLAPETDAQGYITS